MGDVIAFGQFGQKFLETLLTDELVGSQVAGAVPAVIYLDEGTPLKVHGVATFHQDLDVVQRKFVRDEARFVVHVPLGLRLFVLGKAVPDFAVMLTLRINFSTCDPLVLLAGMPALTDDDVTVQWKVSDLGAFKWVLPGAAATEALAVAAVEAYIRRTIRDTVNKQIEDSLLTARTVDLQAVLMEKPSADLKDPKGAFVQLDPRGGMLAPRDLLGLTTLGPNQYCNVDLLLRQGESIKLRIYAQLPAPPPLVFAGVELDYAFGPINSALDTDTDAETVTDGWADVWRRVVVPFAKDYRHEGYFTAKDGGRYRLKLTNAAASGGPVEVAVKQDRKFGGTTIDPRKRISFAKFGENFINIGLSSDFFRQQVEVMLATPLKPVKWKASPFGPVGIAASIKLDKVEDVPSDQPDRATFRRLAVTATVDLTRPNERVLRAKVTATVLVLIQTTHPPPTIEIKLSSIEKQDIPISKMTAIDDATAEIARISLGLFKEHVLDLLRSTLSGLLHNLSIQNVSIADTAAGIIAAAQPNPGGPKPIFEGQTHKGEQVTGGTSRLYRVGLTKDERITVTATMRPSKPPRTIFAIASVAVCDELDGMLDQQDINFDLGRAAPQTLALTFTAPGDGEYRVRVRAHSQGMEDWHTIVYDLAIAKGTDAKPGKAGLKRSMRAQAVTADAMNMSVEAAADDVVEPEADETPEMAEPPETGAEETVADADTVYRLETGRVIHLMVDCPVVQKASGDLLSYEVANKADTGALETQFGTTVCSTCLRMVQDGSSEDEDPAPDQDADAAAASGTGPRMNVYHVETGHVLHLTPDCPAVGARTAALVSYDVSSELDTEAIEAQFDMRVCGTCLRIRDAEIRTLHSVRGKGADAKIFPDHLLVITHPGMFYGNGGCTEMQLQQITGAWIKATLPYVSSPTLVIEYQRASADGNESVERVEIPFDDSAELELFHGKLDEAIGALG